MLFGLFHLIFVLFHNFRTDWIKKKNTMYIFEYLQHFYSVLALPKRWAKQELRSRLIRIYVDF